MINTLEMSRLIGSIYDAGPDHDAWQDLIARIAGAFACDVASYRSQKIVLNVDVSFAWPPGRSGRNRRSLTAALT